MRLIPRRRLRVGVFGYDLKFITPILERLRRDHGMRVDAVESGSLHAFPSDDVEALVRRSDVVVAEFFGPYVERIASMVDGGAPLVVRLHRFELHRGFADDVDPGSIERVVLVNDHYAREFERRTTWPAERVQVIPNAVDIDRFDRPKRPGFELRVGALGMASRRKRLDLALDVIEMVRERQPEAVLSVKGHRPTDLKWVMDDPVEREFHTALAPRLERAITGGAVEWHPHGSDVDTWFTTIGYVLSTSDDESFHMAPAEGMAGGAIPVVRRWPGADTVYAPRWLFSDPEEAAAIVIDYMEHADRRIEASGVARSQAEQFSLDTVAARWATVLASAADRSRSR